jgi:predicted AlkP superfamily pyrophosphatase or phosphodiesterase
MILMIVFDGLRADQVSEKHTPTLFSTAQQGVLFHAHHASFPTETRVNVASLVTGCHPSNHGLIANEFYRVSSDPPQKVNTGTYHDLTTLRAHGDNILDAKCLAELVGPTHRIVSINIGTSGNAYLNNYVALENGDVLIHPEFSLPAAIGKTVERLFGPWPPASTPNISRIKYATQVLLDYVIPVLQPTITSLWFSEPDSTQHKTQVDSLLAQQSIQAGDYAVQQILESLVKNRLLSSTDILLMSDHGHATVSTTVDVATELVEAGLKHSPESTDTLVAGKGGSIAIYVANHHSDTIKTIADFLLPHDWCGPLFTSTKDQSTKTFPLSLVHCQHARSPSLLMAGNWQNSANTYGACGSGVFAEAGVAVGSGSHGSLSPYEIKNVLIAAGPHFKKGITSTIPSGNIDILPTLLTLLNRPSPSSVAGRVLSESLRLQGPPLATSIQTQVYHQTLDLQGIRISQKLQKVKVESTSYIDYGWITRS